MYSFLTASAAPLKAYISVAGALPSLFLRLERALADLTDIPDFTDIVSYLGLNIYYIIF